MPWRYGLTICAAALALGIAGYAVTGSAGSNAATAGFAVGLFAAFSGALRGILIAGIGFICVPGPVVMAYPFLPVLIAPCIALSAMAVVEVARVGTGMSIMVLMGVILFAINPARGRCQDAGAGRPRPWYTIR